MPRVQREGKNIGALELLDKYRDKNNVFIPRKKISKLEPFQRSKSSDIRPKPNTQAKIPLQVTDSVRYSKKKADSFNSSRTLSRAG